MLPFLQNRIKQGGSVSEQVPEIEVSAEGDLERVEPVAELPISEQPIQGTRFLSILQSIVMRNFVRMP